MFKKRKKQTSILISGLLILSLFVQFMFCASANAYALGNTWPNAKAVLNLTDMSSWSTDAYNTANTAAANWNSGTNFTFTRSSSGSVQVARGALGHLEGALTVHSLTHPNQGTPQYYMGATVTVNSNETWCLTGTPTSGQASLLSVLRHEFGHVIGLSHYGSSISDSIMYYEVPRGSTSTIKAIDKTHVNNLYPTSRTLSAPTQSDFKNELDARLAKLEAEENLDLNELQVKVATITLLDYRFPEIVQKADNIIAGTVIAIEKGYYQEITPGNRIAFSKVILKVDETLKGTNSEYIAIKMYGGFDDQYIYVYPEQRIYSLGEKYIIFFSNDNIDIFGGNPSDEYTNIPFCSEFASREIKLDTPEMQNREIEAIKEEIASPSVIQNNEPVTEPTFEEPVIMLDEED